MALLVYPIGSVLPSDIFTKTRYRQLRIYENCLDGNANSNLECVLISVPKTESQVAHFVLIVGLDKEHQTVWTFILEGDVRELINSERISLSITAKQNLLDGDYIIAPPRWSSVQLDGISVHPSPWTTDW
jgi:hypothetical protein